MSLWESIQVFRLQYDKVLILWKCKDIANEYFYMSLIRHCLPKSIDVSLDVFLLVLRVLRPKMTDEFISEELFTEFDWVFSEYFAEEGCETR